MELYFKHPLQNLKEVKYKRNLFSFFSSVAGSVWFFFFYSDIYFLFARTINSTMSFFLIDYKSILSILFGLIMKLFVLIYLLWLFSATIKPSTLTPCIRAALAARSWSAHHFTRQDSGTRPVCPCS